MGEIWNSIGLYLANPQRIIQAVATSLFYPVLFIEVAALLWVVYEAGTYSVEAWKRRRARKSLDVEDIVAKVRAAKDKDTAVDAFSYFDYGPVLSPLVAELRAGELTRIRALKLITDAEQRATRRLDKTRMFVRIGPVLGLMGTLIPISPALVSLAAGDVRTLSTNLIVAFSTTVVGLLIGSVAYVISLGRERAYAQDLSDIEYVLERSGM
jgi:biopolymer transport protein ExbB/TolQ